MKYVYTILFSCLYLPTLHAMDVPTTTPTFKEKIGPRLYMLLTSANRWDRTNALQEICYSKDLKEVALKTIQFVEADTHTLYYRGNMSEELLNKNSENCWDGLFVFDNAPALDATRKALLPGQFLILGRTTKPSPEEYAQMKS